MEQEVIPFKDFIIKKMKGQLIGIPLILALVISLSTSLIIIVSFANSDKAFVESVAPHIATLLETQDRPEIQRFVRAISTKKGAEVEVIFNNEIIASSFSLERIGTEFEKGIISLPFLDLKFNAGKLMSFTIARRENGWGGDKALIGIYLNWTPVIYLSLGISFIVFIFTFFVIKWPMMKIICETQLSLKHLSLLEEGISKLQNKFEATEIPPFPISELESIRSAFVTSQSKLSETNEKLAKSKAKEMASYAYKNLIHDLHVPVTALRNHLKIMGLERATQEDRENALKRIVDLAEQVLKQVKSARSHLGLEVLLKNEDIVESVRKATNNAQIASFDKPNIEIRAVLPDEKLMTSHDSILLGRALSNLITNAIEAASKQVQVELSKIEDGVSIKVNDDGEGLGQEEVSLHLQGRGKSTKNERMGIGLASANHIIRSHGGKIIYQSSSLGGACFEVRLQGDSV